MTTPKKHHWKHGWIPLDDFARGVVAKRDLRESAKAQESRERMNADRMGVPYKAGESLDDLTQRAHAKYEAAVKRKAMAEAHSRATGTPKITSYNIAGDSLPMEPGHAYVDRVEGTPVDFLIQPSDPFRMSPAQQREAAATVAEVWNRFPGLKKESPGVVDGTVLITVGDTKTPSGEEAFATTMGAPPFVVSLGHKLFDTDAIEEARKDWGEQGGAIEGEAKSNKTMRHMAIVHELGHYIQGRNEFENGGIHTREELAGPVDELGNEPVTPREMGFTSTPYAVTPAESEEMLNEETPRWTADSLRIDGKSRSSYALGNRHEWFAEAFLDGYMNGDHASPSGQRAVELVQEVYG